MKIVATIAEYNPLHTGHLLQMDEAKRTLQPDAYAVVMSGNFTERGDIAIAEKHRRAVWAIQSGADIVIELPFFYAVNCAEKFAEGAMKTLSAFNAPLTVAFGSESGDIEKLSALSQATHNESEEQKKIIKTALKEGRQLVKARAAALDFDGDFTPNNILGIEYIHYAEKYGFDVYTSRRQGGYLDTATDGEYASATAIRKSIFDGKIDEISKFLPDYVTESLDSCVSNETLFDMVSYALNSADNSALSSLHEVTEGLENRIQKFAKTSYSYDELTNSVKCKRYTMARIKRIMLYALTNLTITKIGELYNSPPYAHVLAVRRGREDLLNTLAQSNLITREKDIAFMPGEVRRAIEFEKLCDSVYFIAAKQKTPFNCVFVD